MKLFGLRVLLAFALIGVAFAVNAKGAVILSDPLSFGDRTFEVTVHLSRFGMHSCGWDRESDRFSWPRFPSLDDPRSQDLVSLLPNGLSESCGSSGSHITGPNGLGFALQVLGSVELPDRFSRFLTFLVSRLRRLPPVPTDLIRPA